MKTRKTTRNISSPILTNIDWYLTKRILSTTGKKTTTMENEFYSNFLKVEDEMFISDIVAKIQRGEINAVDTKKVSAINHQIR